MEGYRGALCPSMGRVVYDQFPIAKRFPSMYMANFSQAQVMASASHSIWAYLLSVSDRDLDAYAMGCQSLLVLYIRTAPKPYDDASTETFVSF